jgi:hypothetical protein
MKSPRVVLFLFLLIILFAGLIYFYNHAGPILRLIKQEIKLPFELVQKIGKPLTLVPAQEQRRLIQGISSYSGRVRVKLVSDHVRVYVANPVFGEVIINNWIIRGAQGDFVIIAPDEIVVRGEGIYFGVGAIINKTPGNKITLLDDESRFVDEYLY